MTDNNPTDELSLAAQALPHEESPHVQHDDDFSDDDGDQTSSDESELADGDLTPNDIFGLDPLDVLTLEEMAEYLKVSPAAARRVIKEQNLPGRNIGGEWRFLRDAVANWLRGQEAPAVQQQKAREDYSKPKTVTKNDEEERYSRPQGAYRPEQSDEGGYRPKQQYSDRRPQYGNQSQYGNQGGGQYGNREGQYGGGQYGGGQNRGGSGGGGGGQYRGGNYGGGGGGGTGSGGSYAQPPRRPFRSTEGRAEGGDSGGANEGGASGGYTGGSTQYGGGYAGGGQRFGGPPKRKNKRQVFDNERGKRLDRRKEGEAPEGQE